MASTRKRKSAGEPAARRSAAPEIARGKKVSKQKMIHVLSNTHWDREWRFPFQHTRLLLVDLVDRLLDLMEELSLIHISEPTRPY